MPNDGRKCSPSACFSYPNTFMTFAWYRDTLKHKSAPLWEAILVSLADRTGRVLLSGSRQQDRFRPIHRLPVEKCIQEAITLVVFVVFAFYYLLDEPVRWNYAASFVCILAAVAFAFWR